MKLQSVNQTESSKQYITVFFRVEVLYIYCENNSNNKSL